PLLILLLPLAVYWVDNKTSSDEVARNVTVSGVAVGGLTTADATLAVQAHEQELRQSTGVFTVNAETFKLNPLAIGLTANTARAVDDAMAARRDGTMIENFMSWVASFRTVEDVPLAVTYSDAAIADQLDQWEVQSITNPAFDGAVSMVDGVVVPQYPQEGEKINRLTAVPTIERVMAQLDKSGQVLDIIVATPVLTNADIDNAVAEMSAMVDSEVTLRSNDIGFRTSFTPDQLASAVDAELSDDGTSMIVFFDVDTVLGILEPRQSEYEVQPVDAQYDVSLATNEISVVAGRSGTLLDVEVLPVEMKTAALGTGLGAFPLLVGAPPAFSTEQAESYLPMELIGEFTTDHPARQDRVINIQQMALDVDGALVFPGREWSINDRVGERTEAKGYVAAPAIINGQPYCCDHPANIGGGVSQFGTTLFNAVFFACLDDIEHRPHSLSFDRYPEGREATLGFPHPDVRFGNNTDSPVIIKTAYTYTSITVKMFGNNDGKTCTDETHEREDIVEFEEELIADTEGTLVPGQRVKERSGIDGFLVRVDRIVTDSDGTQETDLNLVWRYATLTEQYMVHPCEVSGNPINCPVQLPSLSGSTWDQALVTLQEIGILAARVDEPTENPDLDGVITAQDPVSGTWVNAGSTVTLTVGVFSGGDDE
ncbi:MAG: VanW family protein, partial [Acidimicrobiia bacterium]